LLVLWRSSPRTNPVRVAEQRTNAGVRRPEVGAAGPTFAKRVFHKDEGRLRIVRCERIEERRRRRAEKARRGAVTEMRDADARRKPPKTLWNGL
jgi:hypothetical protein